MYCQSFLVTSVRGIAPEPTTLARSLLGCIGFMKAAFGVRFLPDDDDLRRLLFLAPERAELFLPPDLDDDLRDEDFRDEDFLPPLFFLVAILSPGLVIGCELLQRETRSVSRAKYSAARRKQ